MLRSACSDCSIEKSWSATWQSVADTCALTHRPGWGKDSYFVGAVLAAVAYWTTLSVASAGSSRTGAEAGLNVFLWIVLWQPVFEELLFRGVLQGLLLEETGGRLFCRPFTLANLLASVAFALAHLPAHPFLWTGGILVVSLTLGYLRDRLGSLYPPVLLHIYYNGGYFLLMGWS